MPAPLRPRATERLFQRRQLSRRPPANEAFVLPMAAVVSLLFLLGSLSLQSLCLQSQRQLEARQHLADAEDRLVSAAQVLVADLQQHHACLLPLPRESWAGAACISDPELAQLGEGEVLGGSWRLLRWQPLASGEPVPTQRTMELQIELAGEGAMPARRAAFVLKLTGQPWRVSTLVPLGLRGGLS